MMRTRVRAVLDTLSSGAAAPRANAEQSPVPHATSMPASAGGKDCGARASLAAMPWRAISFPVTPPLLAMPWRAISFPVTSLLPAISLPAISLATPVLERPLPASHLPRPSGRHAPPASPRETCVRASGVWRVYMLAERRAPQVRVLAKADRQQTVKSIACTPFDRIFVPSPRSMSPDTPSEAMIADAVPT